MVSQNPHRLTDKAQVSPEIQRRFGGSVDVLPEHSLRHHATAIPQWNVTVVVADWFLAFTCSRRRSWALDNLLVIAKLL